MKHGHHAATPEYIPGTMEKFGSLWSNYHLWADRLKNIFLPKQL
jgi:hypothetical protein